MPGLQTAEDVRRHIGFKLAERSLKEDVAQRMLDALDGGASPDYAALLEVAQFPDPPEFVYHTAPTGKRLLIQAHGLQARQPGHSGHWRHVRDLEQYQPPGVYVGAEPDLRGIWAHWPTWDIWEIERFHLPWAHDRINPGCWVLTADVPVCQMNLFKTASYRATELP